MVHKVENKSYFILNSIPRIKQIYIWGILIIFYIILFEFLLPFNNILPKPSLLDDSLISLQRDYSLFLNFTYTISGIYIPILAAFFILKYTNGMFRHVLLNFSGLLKTFKLFNYFPLIGVVTLFVFWFPYSSISEYFLSFIISLVYLLRVFNNQIKKTKKEYLEPLIVSAAKRSKVINEITWKSAEPEVFCATKSLQVYLWMVVLFFEYVKNFYGIGNIFRYALLYQDLASLFLLSILLMFVLYVTSAILNFTSNKFFDWEL